MQTAPIRGRQRRWRIVSAIAAVLALASPAFVLLGPEGPIAIWNEFHYFSVVFMFFGEGVAVAACYLVEFVVYFALYAMVLRALTARIRRAKPAV